MARITVQITTPSNNRITVSPGVSALSSVQLYLNELVDVDTSGGQDGYVLTQQADGSFAMNAIVTRLDGLSDTNIVSPGAGDALVYDDQSSKWVPGGVKSVNGQEGDVVITIPSPPPTPGVSGLADTNITNLQDDQIIRYDSNSGNWLNEDLEALPAGGTAGQALVKVDGTDYNVTWDDIAVDVQYHQRYATEAETLRSGATETVELYFFAQGDGNGLAESAESDTATTGYDIRRKLYYSEAAQADPDTGTWTQFADIADNTTFANAKAALLAYLKERTGGTVPISLKMTWEEVAQAPAFTGLLNETYGSGAAAAYGTRRLNGSYTGACMTIRRASDGTTTTIGFDGEDIDEAAIETFCTGTTCTVQVWHDQSQSGGTGSGNDASQTTAANQPTIYTGGALVKEGGRLALDFDGSNDFFTYGIDLEPTTYPNYSNYLVCTPSGQDEVALNITDTTEIASISYGRTSGTFSAITYEGISQNAKSGAHTIDTQALVESYHDFDAGTTELYLNNSQQSGTDAGRGGGGDSYIGQQSSNNLFWSGKIQEVITYKSDKTSVRTDIEGNISDYYQSAKLLNEQYGEGAAAAYSVRQLNRDYTGAAIQVERSSDNTTQDIGFDSNGDLDESALTTFCTGTTCKVRKWYDQSQTGGTGSGNDATQTDHTKQPTIYTGGAIVKENGRVAFGTNTADLLTLSSSFALSDFHVFYIAERGTIANSGMFMGSGGDNTFIWDRLGVGLYLRANSVNSSNIGGSSVYGQKFIGVGRSSNVTSASINGVSTGNGASNTGTFNLSELFGGYGITTDFDTGGNAQEVLIYSSDKSTDRTSIESNVGDYFTQNTPLLDTYTGAAAAYSLRKLRSAYTGSAIRVRRASDNTEQDIGFNVFGELDTVSLASFCSGTNGFVKTWYDQSGNANDATQTTAANQPKIYDSSTGVVTENGKPAVQFDNSNDSFVDVTGLTYNTNDVGAFVVCRATSGHQSYATALNLGPALNSEIAIAYRTERFIYCGTEQGTGNSDLTQNLVSLYADNASNDVKGYIDQVQKLSTTTVSNSKTSFEIANLRGLGSTYWGGTIQEIVFYASSTKSDHTNIESNINTFYSIY